MFHILVVDDDKNTRKYLKAVLEAENYTVTLAENGEEALDIMSREYIDLVVLDIMMPKMDGYEFTNIIREGQSDLPILMVTAKQLPEDKHKGFLVGTDDYITKPIDETEMLLRIRALLRRAKIVSERKIVIGDVTLDYDSQTVARGDEVQELPQKEFLLLYKLLSYQDVIYRKDITSRIQPPPVCAYCGRSLIKKQSPGKPPFWGCPNYPECRYTLDIVL